MFVSSVVASQTYEARISRSSATEDVIRLYDQRAKQIRMLEVEVVQLKASFETAQVKLAAAKEVWETPLREKVRLISQSFSRFMTNIGIQGDVNLLTNDDSDFDSYGLDIRVKFKSAIKLLSLDGSSHSGGERSVCTMVYLLSLQEVTECPFRLVDEVNQGMDPTNERNIFEQIVACSKSESMPQYFIVTPKLLPDLPFPADAAVFCVFNGAHSLRQREWKMPQAVASDKQRRLSLSQSQMTQTQMTPAAAAAASAAHPVARGGARAAAADVIILLSDDDS